MTTGIARDTSPTRSSTKFGDSCPTLLTISDDTFRPVVVGEGGPRLSITCFRVVDLHGLIPFAPKSIVLALCKSYHKANLTNQI